MKIITLRIKDGITNNKESPISDDVQEALSAITMKLLDKDIQFDGVFMKMPDQIAYVWENRKPNVK
jgi:hypothetical protein